MDKKKYLKVGAIICFVAIIIYGAFPLVFGRPLAEADSRIAPLLHSDSIARLEVFDSRMGKVVTIADFKEISDYIYILSDMKITRRGGGNSLSPGSTVYIIKAIKTDGTSWSIDLPNPRVTTQDFETHTYMAKNSDKIVEMLDEVFKK